MALVKCPECARQISDTAAQCPHCGADTEKLWKQQTRDAKHEKTMQEWNSMTPAQKRWGIIAAIVLVILAVFVIYSIMNYDSGECGACRGSGYYEKKTCPFCDGTGYSDYDPYD